MTALDSPSNRVGGLEAGADDFLYRMWRAVTSLEIGVQAPEREAVGDSRKGGCILLVDDRPSSYERLASFLSAGTHR